jgi:hypothetical protein
MIFDVVVAFRPIAAVNTVRLSTTTAIHLFMTSLSKGKDTTPSRRYVRSGAVPREKSSARV